LLPIGSDVARFELGFQLKGARRSAFGRSFVVFIACNVAVQPMLRSSSVLLAKVIFESHAHYRPASSRTWISRSFRIFKDIVEVSPL
jgi:hypothetical protein